MKTLYDLLGVDHEATLADIAHNYRYLLSEQILRHGNQPMRRRDRMRLQKLREAFLLLSSPARRQAYDEQLQALRNARYRAVGAAKTALGALLDLASAQRQSGRVKRRGQEPDCARQ
jgi:curved DNA-binding protein CbpA